MRGVSVSGYCVLWGGVSVCCEGACLWVVTVLWGGVSVSGAGMWVWGDVSVSGDCVLWGAGRVYEWCRYVVWGACLWVVTSWCPTTIFGEWAEWVRHLQGLHHRDSVEFLYGKCDLLVRSRHWLRKLVNCLDKITEWLTCRPYEMLALKASYVEQT